MANKANEAVFELAVDAFLEGVADCLPKPKEYNVTQEQAERVLERRSLLPAKKAS